MRFYYHTLRVYDEQKIEFLCDINLSVGNVLGVNKCGENKIIITYPHKVQVLEVSEVVPHYVNTKEWNTKLKLSSAVTYDSNTNTFIGVFHDLIIRIWTIDMDSFDNAEKFIFQNPILKILPRKDTTSLVIFKNGYCTSLLHALENSKLIKARYLVKNSSSIEESSYYTRNKTDYVCYVVKDKSNQYSVLTFPVREEVADCDRVETVVLRDVKVGPTVISHQIIASGSKKYPFVYFIWNDSRISQLDLQKRSWKVYRGNFQLSSLCKQTTSAITSIDKNYFMFYRSAEVFHGGTRSQVEVLCASHIFTRDCTHLVPQTPLKHRAKSSRVFCPLKGFSITINDTAMRLYRTFLEKVDQWPERDLDMIYDEICKGWYLPLLPACGWNKNKVSRRSLSNQNLLKAYYPMRTFRYFNYVLSKWSR